ncbi:MAG: hypothetical protein ACRD35_03885, partial [Candidatus Acidiferrales bacterium]
TGTSGAAVRAGSPTLTGTVTIDRRLEFTEAAGDPACAAGDFWISVTSDTNVLRKCQNGAASNLDTGGVAGLRWDELAAPTAATILTSDATTETATFSFESAFTTGSQFLVRQQVGNPTGGNLMEVSTADADITAFRVTPTNPVSTQWGIYSGPAHTSFNAGYQGYATNSQNFFGVLDSATKTVAFAALNEDDTGTNSVFGTQIVALASHAAGTRTEVIGVDGEAYLNALGTVTRMVGVSGFAQADTGAGTVTDMASLIALTNVKVAGTVTNNYGVLIQNQAGVGTTNYAIKTGDGSVDFGAATDFKVPTAAGLSPTANGLIAYDSTSNTLEFGNNGTNRVVVGRDTTDTLTNKTIDAEATGNIITQPSKIWIPASTCVAGTATLNWDDDPAQAEPTAACVAGTNTTKGVADFLDSATNAVQMAYLLPGDWTGNTDITFFWFTSVTTNNVVWQVQTICVADAETDDPAFNSANTVTDAAKATANQMNTANITSITITGCAAGEMLHLRVLRDPGHASDTLGATARLYGVELTLRRAI